ncbi:MAG: hypothetical protein IJC02_05860 [Lachnospiraceae bacterium]|nr:hypothetical protein [Lachnospiraceae bacterium]MBQ6995822.1 hypothetical protein [Lachnospiraceae bacterium]
MKQSVWLQNYEQEVYAKRNASNQKKKIIPIIFILMMAFGLIAAISNGALNDPQARTGLLAFVGIFAFLMIYVLILMKIGKKKDVAKYTRNEVMALFHSDYDVEQFDQEMNAAPLKELTINEGTTMFMTENYIGIKSMPCGDLRYSFIRKHDIASFHRKKTASTTGNPMKAAFFFDIRNHEQKVIMNGLADSGKQLEAIIDMLQTANPHITLP